MPINFYRAAHPRFFQVILEISPFISACCYEDERNNKKRPIER